jgi:hypothetical protein
LLAQGGADLLTISKLLGHADTRITARHYAHLCDKTLANTVDKLLPNFGFKPEHKVADQAAPAGSRSTVASPASHHAASRSTINLQALA